MPIQTGHFWLQPVPEEHALVALDITDPEHPREVSSVSLGDDEAPHWIAIDGTGRRVVLNSGATPRAIDSSSSISIRRAARCRWTSVFAILGPCAPEST